MDDNARASRPPRLATLARVRRLIDGIDDGLLALLAARRRLVARAADAKRGAGQAARDDAREREVYARARRLAWRLGVPASSSDRLFSALIADACAQQGVATIAAGPNRLAPDLDHGAGAPLTDMLAPLMHRPSLPALMSRRWLRLVPPPARVAPFVRHVPRAWQTHLLEAAMRRVLAGPLATGALDALEGRRIGIEVGDLDLRWVVSLRDGRMRVCAPGEAAEASVCGSVTDLMLLASRREDADTLFFQRRLRLTGDTELGLTARNLLDQLPWEDIPLGLRIAMHRSAEFAEAARTAHRGTPLLR